MKKQDLVAATGISTTTMTKLNKGRNVNTDILVRICNALRCDVSDIMEIMPWDSKRPYRRLYEFTLGNEFLLF